MSLPQIIILYGPPAAGKGTQAHFLQKKLPDYYHLDFGSELRNFVKQHIGDFHNQVNEINTNAKPELVTIAKRIKSEMRASRPVDTADLRFVIEKTISDCVEKGQGMIIEGPGRLVEEAKWLSGFLAQKSVEVCIFHLYISLEEVLKRAVNRYYLPSTKKPFNSLEAAQTEAVNGELAYRRPEDEDIEGTRQRYKILYSDNFAKIISIYQLEAKALVFTLDAMQPMEHVCKDVLAYFSRFYNESK